MIKIAFLSLLHLAFPNAQISEPVENASYLFDKNKTMMGHFDYAGECFYLNKDYEYFKEAKYKLKEHGINFAEKEYKEGEILYK